ncbi:MAG: UDP-2,3-diacylglucosamine diphosphatase [Pseudomonadota bacterium]
MATLFISDLHLDADAPAIGEQFFRFLNETARDADALYILGDLFEVWVGDDDDAPYNEAVLAALRDLGASGVPVFFMCGNRDFMAGDGFAARAGLTLLDDPTVIRLGHRALLLSHGDAYCTDDLAYQAFRKQSRDPAWQQQMLSMPLAERRALAAQLRTQSNLAMAGKSAAIMDVNDAAVDAALAEHGVDLMLHGHTHRPAVHRRVDGATTRIVLGDWYDQASYLRWDSGDFRLGIEAR